MNWLPDIIMSWRLGGGGPITVYVACAGRGHVMYSNKVEMEPFAPLDGPPFAEADHTLLWGVNVLHTQGLASTVVILADDTDIKVMAVMYAGAIHQHRSLHQNLRLPLPRLSEAHLMPGQTGLRELHPALQPG